MDNNGFVIKLDNVSKKYRIYDKPVDRLKDTLFPFKNKYGKDFYALNEIFFSVSKGESVGIVGKNGAGKSTLLKIIAGVITQTKGSVEVNGKVAALLELGGGFNPDFSGIENIFLVGTIMGYSHKEMEGKLQDILEFADIGSFIYQPVKSYSSGMMMRLAFAVQTQVEPDILIVDEALAVGDAAFQQKCARRIKQLKERGTILLFVSHDVNAIATFCDKAVLLQDGKIIASGLAKDIVEMYLSQIKNEVYVKEKADIVLGFSNRKPKILGQGAWGIDTTLQSDRIGTGAGKIRRVILCDEDGNAIDKVLNNRSFCIKVLLQAINKIEKPILCYRIDNLRGLQITGSTSGVDKIEISSLEAGVFQYVNIKTMLPLGSGMYSLALYFNEILEGENTAEVLDGMETVGYIEIVEGKEVSTPYIIETNREWNVETPQFDPADRKTELKNSNGKSVFDVSILGKHFFMENHWFWTQYDQLWEIDTYNVFKNFICPGKQYVDVGSWIGPTVLFAKALGASEVHAVEANVETAEMLRKSCLNSEILKDVQVHNYCINDKEEIVEFGNLDGSHAISSASSVRGTGFRVQGITLLNFLKSNELLNIPFLKIDIEGAELDIASDLDYLFKNTNINIHLSLHPPFWSRVERVALLLECIKQFHILDSKLNVISYGELVARCRTKEKKPIWGTEFGNFFEIILTKTGRGNK